MQKKYRLELDGMRGIAVLAVCLYHLDLPSFGFSNGFLGVDVFFVLSGYLIARNLLSEFRETKKINLWLFFEKRARRVLPLLFMVCLLTTLFLCPFLLPPNYIELSNSAFAAEALSANIYWYMTNQNYSVQNAVQQPLLHTWSLSLEEQFYFLMPFLLLCLCKWSNRRIKVALLFLVALSFFANLSMDIKGDPADLAFYMLPFRFWQFLVGALVAVSEIDRNREGQARKRDAAIAAIGLFILTAALFCTSSIASYSSLTRLVIVLSAAAILVSGNTASIPRSVLMWQPLRYLGLISYSVYLWHYPIFFAGRNFNFFSHIWQKLILVGLTLIISVFSYFSIEQYFRNRTKVPRVLVFSFLLGIFSISTVHLLSAHHYRGFPDRYGFMSKAADSITEDLKRYWGQKMVNQTLDWDQYRDRMGAVIGNSFALDIVAALNQKNNGFQVLFDGMTGHICRAITLPGKNGEGAQRCRSNLKRFDRDYWYLHFVVMADNLTFIGHGKTEAVKEMKKNVSRLRDKGFKGPIILIGNRPLYSKHVFDIAAEYGSLSSGLNEYAQQYLINSYEELVALDGHGAKTYNLPGVYYLSLVEALCPKGVCAIVEDKELLYHDKVHLSSVGAKYIEPFLLKRLKEIVPPREQEGQE